jgi:hypothetical protein
MVELVSFVFFLLPTLEGFTAGMLMLLFYS